MKQKLSCLIITVLIISICCGQSNKLQKQPLVYGGPGIGLDYGGIGLKLEYLVLKNIGLFGGAGYNFSQLGANGGVSFKVLPNKKSIPVLMAMYGYNGVIRFKPPFNGPISSATYYSFSTGLGYEFIVGQNQNKFCLAVLVPFRNSDFKKDYDALKATGYTFSPDVLPILISVGFNIAGYGRFKRHE